MIFLLRKLVPMLALAGLLSACGGDKKAKHDDHAPAADAVKKEKPKPPVKLAEWIKDKRVWVEEPDFDNPNNNVESPSGQKDECSPPEPAETAPKTASDPVPVPAEASSRGGFFFQFNHDGSLQVGVSDEHGMAVAFPAEDLTYSVKDKTVTVMKKYKVDGEIIFGSEEPTKGESIKLAKEDDGIVTTTTTKITKIEKAAELGKMKFDFDLEPGDGHSLPPAKGGAPKKH